ncbi:archaemetzincin [Novipirellula artificiosorum]|uniref:Peptidase family M54 n=1 Tax=Novipirellula artificiosorum TaxID=2528016 RepID=A0A5C6DDR6_9BACT|nr:archaemetzincin [Novipirellula artificiosorum]TWU33356.1 Peptidase family M54 [Novipirellula artificiosorum]
MERVLRLCFLVVLGLVSQVARSEDRSRPRIVKTFEPVDLGRFQQIDPESLQRTIGQLERIHRKLGKPSPGDWLDQQKEVGQTFRQYVASDPVRPTGRRHILYVQPIGEFDAKQSEIVELASEYLALYMHTTVRLCKVLPSTTVPQKARREHPEWKVPQMLSTYLLKNVLKPRLPDDAAAYIAFTTTDLWPGRGWNFVFGQASLRDRVGVWSMYRNGDPSNSKADYLLCLRRTLRIATHETGHMFSLAHCIAYQCNMCGANHLQESDRLPLYLCPECHAKIAWAMGVDPIERYTQLSQFCKQHEMGWESAYYDQAIGLLRDP